MTTRLVLLGLVPAVAAGRPAPAVDPEPAAPYVWRVAVRFDPHPLLPAGVRGQVVRDVRAALQSGLGEVARVEVADLAGGPAAGLDPLAKAFLDRGWAALEGNEPRPLTGVKAHFLWVRAAAAGFRVEARQLDGSTGLVSPLVRAKETRAPEDLGRLAGLVVGRDFGPVGTVTRVEADGGWAHVRFKGAALPGFDRLVRVGDVFAAAAVLDRPGGPVGRAREYTLLRADEPPVGGEWRCRVLTRFKDGLPAGRGVAGYRCLKLATVEEPVQVRVVGAAGGPAGAPDLLQVRATDADFGVRLDARDALELRAGVFRSPRPLRNVACLVVSLGAGRTELFPVPVVGGGPVTVRFDVNPEQTAKAQFERECEDVRGRAAEAATAHAALLRALSLLIRKGQNRDALARATAGLANLDAAAADLSAEIARLRGQPGAGDEYAAALLNSADEQLQAVKGGRAGVEAKAKELTEVLAKETNPAKIEKDFRARELADRIRQLVDRGEVPEALDLYDELYQLTQQDEFKAQRAKLAADWQPKSAEHKKARDYVAGEWRLVADLPGFKQATWPIRDAAAAIAKADDRLGLRSLISSFEPAYAKLKAVLDALDPTKPADKAAIEGLQTVSQNLRRVEEDAKAALQRIEAAAK